MEQLNILIIEDHHLIIEGYRSLLNNDGLGLNVTITQLNTCEAAFQFLTTRTKTVFDIVFLDWGLPLYERQKIFNGGHLVKYIIKHSPNAKIVVLTSHVEAFTLYQIIKEVRPAALLTKSEFSSDNVKPLFEAVFANETFYSNEVIRQINTLTSQEIYLDNFNRQIIIFLSQGVKTKNIPQYLPLSLSAIDKRKVQIKDYFLMCK